MDTKSLPRWRFLSQRCLSTSLVGIRVAMWKTAAGQAGLSRVGWVEVPEEQARGQGGRTLHDVVVPAIRELAILTTHVQAAQVHLVWLAVLELNELAQPREELCVPVGAVLVGQDGKLAVALRGDEGTVAPAPRLPPATPSQARRTPRA